MRGIYIILNKANQKVYIGKSENLYKRITYHVNSLFNGTNKNKHLQAAFNKYGADMFDISLLQILDKNDDINEREQYWIKFFKADNREFGYNKTKGGDGGNSYVDSMTEEEKKNHYEKMSKINRGIGNPIYKKHCYTNGKILKYISDEEISEYESMGWYKGVPECIKEKERIANTGEANGFYGKKHTEISKQKISESRQGSKNWNYGKVIYHKGNQQKYIKPDEIEQYELNGWKKGMREEVKKDISKKNKGRKKIKPNKNAIKYIYNNNIFYGWRKLAAYLKENGYPTISESTIHKLSNNISVQGYEDLLGKIIIDKEEIKNDME